PSTKWSPKSFARSGKPKRLQKWSRTERADSGFLFRNLLPLERCFGASRRNREPRQESRARLSTARLVALPRARKRLRRRKGRFAPSTGARECSPVRRGRARASRGRCALREMSALTKCGEPVRRLSVRERCDRLKAVRRPIAIPGRAQRADPRHQPKIG